MGPDEYDDAVLRMPRCCPLAMLGDTRSGRQLLADAAADYAEAERIGPLKSSVAGRAILDRIAERLERLVAALESPSAVGMPGDFLAARGTSATSASNTASWSMPAESLGGQSGARTAFQASESYLKRDATLDTFEGSIASGGGDKDHRSLRHPVEAAGSARFSSYSAACAKAEVDDQGSASTRFLSHAAAFASTDVHDYGSTSASIQSHPAAGASTEVYGYDRASAGGSSHLAAGASAEVFGHSVSARFSSHHAAGESAQVFDYGSASASISPQFSGYRAAGAGAEVNCNGGFSNYPVAGTSAGAHDYDIASTRFFSQPAASASAEVYCYVSTLTPIDSRSQGQEVPSNIDQECGVHLAGRAETGDSCWFQYGKHPDAGADGSSSSMAFRGNQVQVGGHAISGLENGFVVDSCNC